MSAQYLRKHIRNGKITGDRSFIFDKKKFFFFIGEKEGGNSGFWSLDGSHSLDAPPSPPSRFFASNPRKVATGLFFLDPFFTAGNGELEEEEVYGCPLE